MKRRIIVILSLSLSFLNNAVHAQRGLLDTLNAYIEEFKIEVKKEDGKLWGELFEIPMLIKTNDFIVCSEPVDGFKKYKSIYFGTAEDYTRGGNSCVSWRGKNWATFTYDANRFNNRESRHNLFFHEAYHCLQFILNLGGQWTQCKHLNEFDARCLLRLELNALLKALESNTTDTASLVNALAYRAYRYALYPNAYLEEAKMEMLEGVANYTGLKLSGKTKEGIVNEIKSNMSFNPQLFAYLSGALYCFNLDKIDSTWRSRIKENDNFLYFTQSVFNIQLPESLLDNYTNTREMYNWSQIESEEKQIVKETKQKQEHYTRLFFESPVLHIPFNLCQGFTFKSTIIFPLENGKVYNEFYTSGEWGNLISTGEMFMGNELVLTKPMENTSATVKGEGWNINLNPQWIVKEVSPGRFELVKE